MTSVAEWRDKTLGEVLTLQRGFDLPARDRIDGHIPIVSSSGVTGHHVAGKVDPPGVVIGRYGTLGQVHWMTERYWPLNTALWVKDFKGNDPRFVSYLLRTVSSDGSAASAVPGVNRNHLHRLPVRVPSVQTQRRIAATLSAFDDLIAINERRSDLLEDIARSLYREWFVRFRFPGRQDEFRRSPRAGWQLSTLGEMARWFSGGTPSTTNPDYWDGGIPWITSGSLRALLLTASERTLTPAGVAAGSRLVERDTLLFVVRGMSLVREFRVGIADRALAFGQDCKALTAVDGVHPLYLAFSVLSRQHDIQRMVELAGHGTGKLSTDRLKAVEVPLPPESVQSQFAEAVAPIRELISVAARSARRLAETRDLVLPRLVTGRLDMDEIDLAALLAAAEDA